MISFGDYVKLLRGDRTQLEVSKIVGISEAGISKIESGHTKTVSISTLSGLARALRVPVAKLIAVYEGKDPEKVLDEAPEDQSIYRSIVLDMLKKIPRADLLKLVEEMNPPESAFKVIEQIKKERNK